MSQAAQLDSSTLASLIERLRALRMSMSEFEQQHDASLAHVAPAYRASARNLLHYLAMRRQDLRPLQHTLASLGLSSLGRAEACALSSVSAVLNALQHLIEAEPQQWRDLPCDLAAGAELLDRHTSALLGSIEPEDRTHIMVTMSSEAATDYGLIHGLLEAGMTCMRINCAHDGPQQWEQMIQNLHQAKASLNKSCSILMDLGGPKLRTGHIEAGPAVLKVKPTRDACGRVMAPVRLWLHAHREPPPSSAHASLHVDQKWLHEMEIGDEAGFDDVRGRHRVLRIVDHERGGLWAEMDSTAYFTNGIELKRRAHGHKKRAATNIVGIDYMEGEIPLGAGDVLVLTKDRTPGRAASYDTSGSLLSPARVSCTLPQIFNDVRAGDRVCFDDGRFVGRAETVAESAIHIRIERTPKRRAKLKQDKGINFPDTELQLPALTDKDKEDLRFAARHADMIGLSFVNRESDVQELIDELHTVGEPFPGIVLKIETQRGFQRLPALLLAAMRHERVGVMIARGDLAVECGYERLAEAQEEILWICEAAHCPSIWATQVLESLAKEGLPSRAEITDAAMGHRAECVMLNKGPYIAAALRVLGDILNRMEAHQSKKRAMLRALRLATEFEATV